MLFGLCHASQTLKRFVDRVLRGLPFVYAHVDDLLAASNTAEEHIEHLAMVFDRLQRFGVVLNPSKCAFGVPYLEFLGRLVDSNIIHPLPSKVAAIRDFPPLSSKRQLQRFLGMVTSDKLNHREICHLDCILQFTSDIRHIDGSSNEVADALSRPSSPHLQLSPGIDLAEMAAEQHRVGFLCDEDLSGFQLQDLPLTDGNDIILCDVFTTSHHPFVPSSVRLKVSFPLHNLSLCSHPHYSLQPGSQRDGRTVSPPAESLPMSRRPSGVLDRSHPLFMLGIRSCLNSDLDCSAAKLVFGATDRIPDQMISPTSLVAVQNPTNFLHRLWQLIRTLSPFLPRPSVSKSYLEKDLATCPHVYLRCDRVRRPLEPPCDGLFRVTSRGRRNFRIQRGTREGVASVDRLKAAVRTLLKMSSVVPYTLLHLPDPLSLRTVYFLCPHVRDPQLQLPLINQHCNREPYSLSQCGPFTYHP
ncbi:hypothetical protein SprV_0200787700 [Sparganum proliferum]